MGSNPTRSVMLVCASLVAMAASCSSSSGTNPSSATINIVITPSTVSLVVGQTAQLRAVVQGPPGIPQRVVWSSHDANIATVTSSGLVRAIAEGNIGVRAAWATDEEEYTVAEIIVTSAPLPGEQRVVPVPKVGGR